MLFYTLKLMLFSHLILQKSMNKHLQLINKLNKTHLSFMSKSNKYFHIA